MECMSFHEWKAKAKQVHGRVTFSNTNGGVWAAFDSDLSTIGEYVNPGDFWLNTPDGDYPNLGDCQHTGPDPDGRDFDNLGESPDY